MRLATIAAVILLVSAPAEATPVTFGPRSFDGIGLTLPDVVGLPASQFWTNADAFAPGAYAVTFTEGLTGWRELTTVRAVSEHTATVVLPPGSFGLLTVHLAIDEWWWLDITSPDLANAPSTSTQWAWYLEADGARACGAEDIALPWGDADFQDLRCRVMAELAPIIPSLPIPDTPHTVPEPASLLLLGAGLIGVGLRLRAKREA